MGSNRGYPNWASQQTWTTTTSCACNHCRSFTRTAPCANTKSLQKSLQTLPSTYHPTMDGPSATDSILQNSAALHSLKKEQLVRLCKAHGVKANGKKSEMAERLAQLHAANEGSSADGAKENMNPTAEEVGREIIHLGSIKEESASDFGSFKCKSFIRCSFPLLIQVQPPCPSSLSYLPLAFLDPRLLHCLPLPKHNLNRKLQLVASLRPLHRCYRTKSLSRLRLSSSLLRHPRMSMLATQSDL